MDYRSKLWARAKASRVLYAWIPYLRYVGLNGSLTNGRVTDRSDIDLMVVTQRGHIFTVRFLMISVLWFYNLKRNRRDIAGRLCVNYFVTDDNLDIKPHTKKVAGFFKYMVGLVDTILNIKNQKLKRQIKYKIIHSIIIRQNQWMSRYRIPISVAQKKRNVSIAPLVQPWKFIRSTIEFLLLPVADALEILSRKIQLWKIARHPLTASNPDKIIVSDKELMFHPKKHPPSLKLRRASAKSTRES